MLISYVLLALAMGAVMSVYVPMVARSAQIMGAAPMGNVPFFFIAFLSSVAIAVASGSRTAEFQKALSLPVWLYAAGVMSAMMIIATSFLVPRIGIGPMFVFLVAGQVLAGMAFGYMGIFGIAAQPLTIGKIAGAVMVIAGVYLVTFK